MKKSLAILAYGSLIDEPGSELEKVIISKIKCRTPFAVEFSRMSKSRDFAPTLIPVESEGSTVNAILLLLDEAVSIDDARDMLWRRETRQTGLNYKEKKKPGANDVQIKTIKDFEGVEVVIYTSIGSNLSVNSPSILARLAIDSILNQAGENKTDGIRYLLSAKKNGIVTPKSGDYEKCILEATGAKSLEEAIAMLDSLRPGHIQQKKSDSEFEKDVIKIGDLICEYGIKKTLTNNDLSPKELNQFMDKNRQAFIINCHEGFKKAQDEIVKMLLEYEIQIDELSEKQKVLRKERDKSGARNVTTKIKIIEERATILRHMIDTIAWQMIGGQLYISRRLYNKVEGKKRLLKSNVKSVVEVSEGLNKVPEDFALITDLSSYIQAGDILLKKGDGSIAIVEVKEGSKNHQILDIIHKVFDPENQTPAKEIMDSVEWDQKSIEQFERNLKQFQQAVNIASVLNNDEGVDSSGKPIKIITPREAIPRFEKELHQLYIQLKKNNLWAYQVIETCLHVGMYKGPLKFLGPNILKTIGEHEGENILIVDFLNVIESLNKPLLFLPFPKDFLFDILFRRIDMYFMLNIDRYLNLFENYGLTANWLSKKETMKVVQGKKDHELFIYKGRGIKVIQNGSGKEMYLSHGILTRIFFEHIHPSYTAYSCNYLLEFDDDADSRSEHKSQV